MSELSRAETVRGLRTVLAPDSADQVFLERAVELLEADGRKADLTRLMRLKRGQFNNMILMSGQHEIAVVGAICLGRGHSAHEDSHMCWRLNDMRWRDMNDWDGTSPSEVGAWFDLEKAIMDAYGCLGRDRGAP